MSAKVINHQFGIYQINRLKSGHYFY